MMSSIRRHIPARSGLSRHQHLRGEDRVAIADRPRPPSSRVVGLYQMLMRRYLEHFFPDAVFETAGDRSFIELEKAADRSIFRVADDPDGLGLEIELFRTRYQITPGSPSPFLPTERRLVRAVLRVLERRYSAIYDAQSAEMGDALQPEPEDQIIAEYLGTPHPNRIPAAIEALRGAALSTFENRRLSTGALLLGTPYDPAYPGRVNPPGAPRYGVRLSAIKSFHRICDGLRTVYVVDQAGDISWPVDLTRWAATVHGEEPLTVPCPRAYIPHARATRKGNHVVVLLSPAQQIKVFAEGRLRFSYGDARWRLMDIPNKFVMWREAVGTTEPVNLADRLFQAALNLAEERHGALFVLLREPARSLPQLVAPGDQILYEVAADDPVDPDNASPRLAKRSLHHMARGQTIGDLDDAVLEAFAGIDGAVVTDHRGRLLSFGAILRLTAETMNAPRAVEGARTTAALAASYHGPVLKVSEDGVLTMFLGGRRVWEL